MERRKLAENIENMLGISADVLPLLRQDPALALLVGDMYTQSPPFVCDSAVCALFANFAGLAKLS